MKCPICRGTTRKGYTNLPIETKTGLVYVKNVPAQVCTQCKESFIPDDVAKNIENIVDSTRNKEPEVKVIDYPGAA